MNTNDITAQQLLDGGVKIQNELCWGMGFVIVLLLIMLWLINKKD